MSADSRRRTGQPGVTLIELVIFIVIIGVGIAGILSVFNIAVRSSADPLLRKQALAIAEALIEEIVLKAYADPDGASGETDRTLMDDVSDYAYFDGSSAAKTISGDQTLAAASLADLAGYQARVGVVDTTLGGVAARRITVTVAPPAGEEIALVAYRTDR